MLFCKLLLSPMPHARVRHIDTREALAMPGVRAILTADELPPPADSLTDNGTVIKANPKSERALTMEPVYQGEPILAVAAVDELTAADAIEKIQHRFRAASVRDRSARDPAAGRAQSKNRREHLGSCRQRAAPGTPPSPPPSIGELKWTRQISRSAKEGQLPMGKTPDQWSYGDLDAGFKNAALDP